MHECLYDFTYIRSLSSSPEFLKEMIALFLKKVPPQIDLLESTVLQPASEEPAKILHQLKPSLQMIGCHQYLPECISLEYALRSGENRTALLPRFKKLVEGARLCIQQLEVL